MAVLSQSLNTLLVRLGHVTCMVPQHLFMTEQRDDLMKAVQVASRMNIGYDIS